MAFTVLLLLAPKPFEGRSALVDSCADINSAPSVEELIERCRKAEGCAVKRRKVPESEDWSVRRHATAQAMPHVMTSL